MVPTLGVGSVVIDEVIAPADARPGRHRHLQGSAPPAPAHPQASEGARGGRYVLHDHPGRRERRARALVRAAHGPYRPRGGASPEARIRARLARLAIRPPGRVAPSFCCSARSCSWTCGGPGGASSEALAPLRDRRGDRGAGARRGRRYVRGLPGHELEQRRAASRRAASSCPTTTAAAPCCRSPGGYPGAHRHGLHRGHLLRVARRGRAPVRDHDGHRPRPVPRPQGHARHLQLEPRASTRARTSRPDATNYIGAGAGVVYNGTLQGYADDYAGGLVDPPSGGPETWTTGEKHVYKIQVTLQNNAAAAGKNATQDFTLGGAQPVTRTPLTGAGRARSWRASPRRCCSPAAPAPPSRPSAPRPPTRATRSRPRRHSRPPARSAGYDLVDESSTGQAVRRHVAACLRRLDPVHDHRLGRRIQRRPLRRLRHERPAPVRGPGRLERQLQDEVRLHRRGGLGQRMLLLRGAPRLHRRRARDLRQLGQPRGVQHGRDTGR